MNKSDKEGLICPKCKAEITLGEARGTHISTPETVDKEFQVDKFGNFRIVVGGIAGEWTTIHNIAVVEQEDKKFFAVHPNGIYAKMFHPGEVLKTPETSK
jgi:hypothetical protein